MAEITSIILAAGEGKRLHSALTKTLHPVCGAPMISYPVAAARAAGAKRLLVVVPPQKDHPLVRYLKGNNGVQMVVQKAPRGTGDAVLSCASVLKGENAKVLILCGDTPLLTPESLEHLIGEVSRRRSTVGFITTPMSDPHGFGRIVRDANGNVVKIVEEKEATEQERKIREINTGVYCVDTAWLFPVLKRLKSSPKTGEYYLTDIVEAAIREGKTPVGCRIDDPDQFIGVNTREQLSLANGKMRERLVKHWMGRGVSFVDPAQVYLESNVVIGPDTLVYPQVYLQGNTKVGKGCVVECGAVLRDMDVGDGVHIKPYCVLEGSVLGRGAVVGPFARIRPESEVGEGARLGNFVELKKAKLAAGVKANHLTYLGDVTIGAKTNVGCGTITCNYDGVKKHPTKIGKNVFVGSDVQFVAPVSVGDNVYIGAGSTITEDVPSGALAIARSRQVNKKGWVKRKKK